MADLSIVPQTTPAAFSLLISSSTSATFDPASLVGGSSTESTVSFWW